MIQNLITIVISLLALSACNFTITGSNSGKTDSEEVVIADSSADQTRTYEVAPFDELTVNIPCDVVYEAGAPRVVVVANAKYMEHIVVEHDGRNGLVIKTDDKKIRSFKHTKIYVTSDCLSALTVNGAVDMECKHGIRSTGDFAITLNGAGDLDIAGLDADEISIRSNGACDLNIFDINASALEVTMNGAGDINVGGNVEKARLTINGAGDIDATKLAAATIRSSVNGIGSIRTQ